jgi:hypothetical protein
MNTNAIIMNNKTKYKGKKKIKHNVTKKLKYMASMGGKSFTTLKKKKTTGGATDEEIAAEKATADAQAQAIVSSPAEPVIDAAAAEQTAVAEKAAADAAVAEKAAADAAVAEKAAADAAVAEQAAADAAVAEQAASDAAVAEQAASSEPIILEQTTSETNNVDNDDAKKAQLEKVKELGSMLAEVMDRFKNLKEKINSEPTEKLQQPPQQEKVEIAAAAEQTDAAASTAAAEQTAAAAAAEQTAAAAAEQTAAAAAAEQTAAAAAAEQTAAAAAAEEQQQQQQQLGAVVTEKAATNVTEQAAAAAANSQDIVPPPPSAESIPEQVTNVSIDSPKRTPPPVSKNRRNQGPVDPCYNKNMPPGWKCQKNFDPNSNNAPLFIAPDGTPAFSKNEDGTIKYFTPEEYEEKERSKPKPPTPADIPSLNFGKKSGGIRHNKNKKIKKTVYKKYKSNASVKRRHKTYKNK